jgi:hypothetical protein
MGDNTCSKHDDCIGRINDNINKIQVQGANTDGKIDGFITSVNDFLASIRKDIYARDGLMQRVGMQGNQIILQWGLLAVIVIAILVEYFKK